MWSTWTEKAKEALEKTSASLENTGDAFIQAARKSTTNLGASKITEDNRAFEKEVENLEQEISKDSKQNYATATANSSMISMPNIPKVDKDKVMNLWSTVVETTKKAAEDTRRAADDAVMATKDAVEISRSTLERQFQIKKGFHKRDLKLPLDVEALRDAEVVYITDRIITMSHPATASKVIPAITAERKLAAVGHLLDRRHDGRYLCWNLSEVDYDISILNDQVLTFSFPGSPSPPLGLLLKLLISMENWMKADKRNVAVVHCLTGRGRTSTILAAFLCWMGEAGFGDVNEAIAYIAKRKQLQSDDLTIPSQRRYASYFKNILDGVRPSQPPLMLKRIIMSEAPKYAKGPLKDKVQVDRSVGSGMSEVDEQQLMGCAPYLQIFKGGKLLHTSAASLHVQQSEEELPFVQVMDGTVPFNINQIIQGDILIRCRHLTFGKKRVSMFRAGFHTGYAPPNVLRLSKNQLDGACNDKRYPDDFFLDLIFEKVDADDIATIDEEREKEESNNTDNAQENKVDKRKGPVVKASDFDSMLQGDSRFWDVIAAKKHEHVKQADGDPYFGPTVGRRRGDSKKGSRKDEDEKSDKEKPTEDRNQLETFSIGNEFDFLPVNKPGKPKKPLERDSLMDALNALDEEEGQGPDRAEEIVFAKLDSSSKTDPPKSVFDDRTDVAIADSGKEQPVEVETEKPKDAASTTAATKPEDSAAEADVLDDEDEIDALLASADEDFGDLDLADFDDDDDLEDLENMLRT